MNTAIITGADGFIGSAVCRNLMSHGVAVYAVTMDKKRMTCSGENLTIIEANLDHYLHIADLFPRHIDAFYHFAWAGTSGAELCDYRMQIKNIQYTCDALTLAMMAGCKKFIMAGTINELELFQFMDAQEFRPRKACIYGAAKLASDFMCKAIAQDDILFNCAIIGSCFGPGDRSRRIHNNFIHGMLTGTPPRLVAAETLHDWIYIDDVAEMFYQIGKKSTQGKNYYLGHRQLRKLKDILLEVRDILNPGLEVKFGEIEDSFQIDYKLVDLNSIYHETGYEPHSDFTDCILKTAAWVKELYFE